MRIHNRVALIAAVAIAAPAAAHAQQTQPAAPPAPAVAPAAEIAQLQQRIGALQQQALADPALRGVTDSLNTTVQQAMARLDPAATGKAARAASITQEGAAARAANDTARINQLADEATQLQAYFDALRPRAMEDEQVKTARAAYLARVFARMQQIDPNVQQYVDRLSELRRANPGS